MNIKKTIRENAFKNKDAFSQIRAIAIIPFNSIASCHGHKPLIEGER